MEGYMNPSFNRGQLLKYSLPVMISAARFPATVLAACGGDKRRFSSEGLQAITDALQGAIDRSAAPGMVVMFYRYSELAYAKTYG